MVTVTAVGKPGTQAWLAADAKAGDTNIKVTSVANISVGDKIRLDIDSVGHGIETVTVTSVGTQSARNSFNGPLRDTELGTGLDLAAPLKFNHCGQPALQRSRNGNHLHAGDGVCALEQRARPAARHRHHARQPAGQDHAIDAVVRDAAVTTAGYQGTPAPNQWFGGPALSPNAGSMVLRDAAGLVVDSLNYGLLVDPWAAEGYQGVSGAGQSGCRVTAPGAGGRGGGGRTGRAGRRRARSQRGPFPGWPRHRQQLHRFPVAGGHDAAGRVGRRRDQYQGGQRDRLRRRSDDHD